MSTTISFDVSEAVARITFASPNGINILSTSLFGELLRRLDDVAADPEVRVLVLTGDGKTFLAGADIGEMSGAALSAGAEFSRRGRRVMDRIAGLESAVTIAAINGGAFGGGCELAVACDFRVMSESAKIGLTETRLGLVPGWGGMQRVMALVGPSRARRMVFTGEPLDAGLAADIGLVNEVVAPDRLVQATRRLSDEILANGPLAVRLAKRCLIAAEQGTESASLMEAVAFGEVFRSEQGREGLKAFIEKRRPVWS
ncbi:MAG: enoyl-CoA hydratase-related protein [Phycisphaerae bacterium]